MHEVDVYIAIFIDVDSRLGIGQLVELCFCLAPVEARLPVLGKALDVLQRRAIIPIGAIKLYDFQSVWNNHCDRSDLR